MPSAAKCRVDIVYTVALSPDGGLLLTGGRVGGVTLWEVDTGRKRIEKVLHTLGSTSRLSLTGLPGPKPVWSWV